VQSNTSNSCQIRRTRYAVIDSVVILVHSPNIHDSSRAVTIYKDSDCGFGRVRAVDSNVVGCVVVDSNTNIGHTITRVLGGALFIEAIPRNTCSRSGEFTRARSTVVLISAVNL
jgi:hypothetical protein